MKKTPGKLGLGFRAVAATSSPHRTESHSSHSAPQSIRFVCAATISTWWRSPANYVPCVARSRYISKVCVQNHNLLFRRIASETEQTVVCRIHSRRFYSVVEFMRTCTLRVPFGGFPLSNLKCDRSRVALWRPPASSENCSFYFDMDEGGLDTEGKTYSSRKQMWEEEAGEDGAGNPKNADKKQEWYHKGVSYWEGVEASVDGVLGGYGNVNDRDVVDSKAFLAEIFKECPPNKSSNLVALDCGAGVGRVTKNFLLQHFHEVDVVEPVRHFLEKAQADLGGIAEGNRAVNFFCTPLQEFTPEAGRYDIIWVQWCIGHLTDHDFLEFFKRARIGLKPGGFFVLKENIAKNGFVVDKEDTSVTRSDAYFRDLFKQTGYQLYKTKLQKGFPKDLFAVRMYAISPELRVAPVVASEPVRAKRRTNQPRRI